MYLELHACLYLNFKIENNKFNLHFCINYGVNLCHFAFISFVKNSKLVGLEKNFQFIYDCDAVSSKSKKSLNFRCVNNVNFEILFRGDL